MSRKHVPVSLQSKATASHGGTDAPKPLFSGAGFTPGNEVHSTIESVPYSFLHGCDQVVLEQVW